MAQDVDPVVHRAGDLAGSGVAAAGCRCTRLPAGSSRSTPRTGTGCRPSPPSRGPGRWRTPRRGRSSPHRSRAAGAARRSRRCGTAGTRRGRARPQWARLTSPGRTRPVPPPRRLALLASWWGAKNGGRRIRSSPGSRAPASEWIAVSSSDSSSGEVGQDPRQPLGQRGLARPLGPGQHQVVATGRRHLQRVLHVGDAVEVGEVVLGRAAATRATRSAGCPTSARPGARRAPARRAARPAPGPASASRGPSCPGPSPPRAPAARARSPGRNPRRDAAITIGSTPGTERSPPVRVSSPITRVSASARWVDVAARGQHGQRDGQVEVGAALDQVGRRQQDRDPTGGGPRHARS